MHYHMQHSMSDSVYFLPGLFQLSVLRDKEILRGLEWVRKMLVVGGAPLHLYF